MLKDSLSNKVYSVVLCIECPCTCFYIGVTKRQLSDTVNEHAYALCASNWNYRMAKQSDRY